MRSSCVVQNIIKKRLSMFRQHRAAPDRWHLPALNKVPMHSMAHPTEETNWRVLKCPFTGMDDNTTWIFCFNQAKHLFLILFYSRRVHLWVKYFHSFSCLMFCILYWSCITFSVPHLSWTTMSILWRICPTARDHLFGRTRCFQVVKNQ